MRDFYAVEVASRVRDAPEVWTDGSPCLRPGHWWCLLLVLVSLHTSRSIAGRATGGVMLIMSNLIMWYSRVGGFTSVPEPLQTVQRAELWSAILALQSSDAVHIGLTIWAWFGMLGDY